ncbi:DUF188 domain-containing protein [Oceanotoga sp. DSM 15011]|uniref:YaiI/YqxD family protein n=1 Tax=Oceanotoga sp. DSM 15011 TaxID=2984951 RepID=UPI0021F3DC76|nr:DUF188 domain-containing protein [Oceanotoga sp. DSM 15011]UYO98842.1 DUF188 domain-containing protein [Oceanotoga sp. DSM 15011]
MKILVDADACPVKEIIIEIAKKFNIDVNMYFDESHIINFEYSKNIVVASGKDSADFKIVNDSNDGDIVVTNDYGLASMALAKKTFCIDFYGKIIDENNIDILMMKRYLNQKQLKKHKRIKGPAKRTYENDEKFKEIFLNLIKKRTI